MKHRMKAHFQNWLLTYCWTASSLAGHLERLHFSAIPLGHQSHTHPNFGGWPLVAREGYWLELQLCLRAVLV